MSAARILIVDDDEGVRQAVGEALSVLGYTVDPVSGAGEALARFRPGRYRLVVTDLAMPVMNGLQLAQCLRALEPSLPIMLFSGGIPPADSIEASGVTVAHKPDVATLARLVQSALGGS